MEPLNKSIRNQLEKTIKEARDIAEAAAGAALEQLGVGESVPFGHLKENERDLRRRLRAHGRQLGDIRNGGGTQEIDRLTEAVAYEHWHRMLFAWILAENNLLMYPDPDDPVPVSLEECEDLAADEGAANGWELAARFAAGMLPQVFRPDSPVFELTLPPEHQQKLEHLLTDLPRDVFTASDTLGWVYQFWQAKKKDQVNASGVKIGARELPAVTQLFTESYMVSFLLDNSLGAWWAARRLTEADLKTAGSEVELRSKAAIPGVPLEFLRFVRQEDDTWMPAAGWFEAWPDHLAELKAMDHACGSGHFLVALFLMLVPMRMELEELSAREAVDAVLKENIHGLEIDKRCVELAAFALGLAAWTYPGASGYRPLPELNLACTGLTINVEKEDLLVLIGDANDLSNALEDIYEQFKEAPVVGSLINPEACLGHGSLFELSWEEVGPLVSKAFAEDRDVEKTEIGVVANGIAKAAMQLVTHYHLVMTNVPYLARGRQTDSLKQFISRYHQDAKQDLATVFLDRAFRFNLTGGAVAIVCPQNWLLLPAYSAFRRRLLANQKINVLAKLGPRAFETISGEVVNVALMVITADFPPEDHKYHGLDVSGLSGISQKAEGLINTGCLSLKNRDALEKMDARITLKARGKLDRLDKYANSPQGIKTGDDFKYRRNWWEVNFAADHWRPFQGTPRSNSPFGGMRYAIDWRSEGRNFARLQGQVAWGSYGIIVKLMGGFTFSLYNGQLFDSNVTAIVPNKSEIIPGIWSFCLSPEFAGDLSSLEEGIKVNNATVVKVPFDLDHWTRVAEEKYPNGLPKPYSDDPTQWIFHGHPCGSVVWDDKAKWTAHGPMRTDDTVLQVAVARLLGYRWPAELDAAMELADEQREWVNRCEPLLAYADKDGIVCIPPVRGETSAADRLLNMLAAAYGHAWSNDTLAELLKNADHAGKDLETWLRDKFFTQHCKLFHHRPFIWHIWDGLRDGFAALVNYHKLDKKNLETLIYLYLGDWINRQGRDITNKVDGAEERLAAAEQLKKHLELILEGEAPYDIFVRWKPLEKQPIGWDPDLNDGVRLNIRPFMSVPDIKKKGAGVLRDRPNIKWNKDRGRDVKSAPWYHLFKGERINDYHLTLKEKNNAVNPN